MVKVLLLKQLFERQQIISLEDEPLRVKVTGTKENCFIVATKKGKYLWHTCWHVNNY
jgi:hypothetical protein